MTQWPQPDGEREWQDWARKLVAALTLGEAEEQSFDARFAMLIDQWEADRKGNTAARPAFRARGTASNMTFGTLDRVPFDGIMEGNGWGGTEFTAPTTGPYQFNVSMIRRRDIVQQTPISISTSRHGNISQNYQGANLTGSGTWMPAACSALIWLQANDRVWVSSQDLGGNNNAFFSNGSNAQYHNFTGGLVRE